mmetsp:Transcript_11758/g.28980  ORF Transcript_11758/g.28980 Transcript_11758/m.28980 type:complete len:696 (-) Transcript_11758:194-2281(-)
MFRLGGRRLLFAAGAARRGLTCRAATCGLPQGSSSAKPLPRGAYSFGLIYARRFSTSPTLRRELFQLEKEANDLSHDPEAQRKYYEALLANGSARRVVTRFDTGKYAADGEVYKLYIQACVESGMTHKIKALNMEDVTGDGDGYYAPRRQSSRYASSSASPRSSSRYFESDPVESPSYHPSGSMMPVGTLDAPVYVQMKPESWRDRILGSLISAAGLVIVFSIAAFAGGYFVSDRLPGVGRTKSANEVSPINVSKISFDDVKGCKEAKMELQEIVQFLKEPEKFTRLGGNLPRGVLLMGPPGTGKTLLAKAVAGEAGVPFFSASGSEFEEMYVGVGARRVRDLFAAAKERSPCLIFIDEIDAIGGSRKAKEQQSMRLTLNQLLVELDGFNTNSGVIVLAATNFPELLDKALTRAGRFDRHITVPLPDVRGRTEILKFYTSKLPVAGNVNCKVLARGTPGYSGADLSTMVNDAAIHASMRGSETVSQEDFEYAKDKMFMGPERKSAYLTPESRKLTAYHEGGHAIVAIHTDGAHPVHKATIMPRGNALGMVFQLPNGDQTSISRKQLIAEMDVCMGGRAAEEMVFGRDNVTTGASSDMRRATQIARAMVLQYGMSDKVGVVDFDQLKDSQLSASTRALIDAEIKSLLDSSYSRVSQILRKERSRLDTLATALMQHETLTGEDIEDVLSGKDIGSKI